MSGIRLSDNPQYDLYGSCGNFGPGPPCRYSAKLDRAALLERFGDMELGDFRRSRAVTKRTHFERLFAAQGLDNGTFWGCPALAAGGRLGKRPFHAAEISNLAPDILQVNENGFLYLAAGAAVFDEAKQVTNFIESKA
ncbi:hypothetical protein ABIE65_005146 [Constrictibacter sp. MBR-5]